MRGFEAFADRIPIVKGALGGGDRNLLLDYPPTSSLLLPDGENTEEPV